MKAKNLNLNTIKRKKRLKNELICKNKAKIIFARNSKTNPETLIEMIKLCNKINQR